MTQKFQEATDKQADRVLTTPAGHANSPSTSSPRLSSEAHFGGYFFAPAPKSGPMKYSKLALSIADQLAKLISKGLLVTNTRSAKRCLTTIGYYRLSAYA